MDVDDSTKVKIWQDMYKRTAWELKQLEQLGYELGEKIEPGYFHEVTKKIDYDEWWKNYIRSRMSQDDVLDNNAGKTEFKPGDKFILELGQERKMFDEFEIVGTDLYVKTSLLEKLTRYEQEEKLDSAQSEPPRAYWIRGKYSWDDYHYNDTSYKCSRCGKVDANIPRYCPGCGAKMEEEIR